MDYVLMMPHCAIAFRLLPPLFSRCCDYFDAADSRRLPLSASFAAAIDVDYATLIISP